MNRTPDVCDYRLEFPRADGTRGFEMFAEYDAAMTAARWTVQRAPDANASATVCGVRWNGDGFYMRTVRKP